MFGDRMKAKIKNDLLREKSAPHLCDRGRKMEIYTKLKILADGAKYDAACTSSGGDRGGKMGQLGSTLAAGCCHSFSADGRCVTLLKVLMSNACVYDCAYCVNRRSNDGPRATFEPEELARLTIEFYRRNYIEGLFLSSGVVKNPDYTTELMISALSLIRNKYKFNGYIHVKAIPGASPLLIERIGCLADRISVNIELPSSEGLRALAPDKPKEAILKPMGMISGRIKENKKEMVVYKSAARFAPAGQSTQMIIGATNDSDYKILHLSENLYKKYSLKRVFYSAYIPVADNPALPSVTTKPPLLREHRIYQADWLLRYYGFEASEILEREDQNFNLMIDPKCNWALNHLELFPIEINTASKEELLRIPGVGPTSVFRILAARRAGKLDFAGLRRIGVVLKRAQYFITCGGKMLEGLIINENTVLRGLVADNKRDMLPSHFEQLSLFDHALDSAEINKMLITEVAV